MVFHFLNNLLLNQVLSVSDILIQIGHILHWGQSECLQIMFSKEMFHDCILFSSV